MSDLPPGWDLKDFKPIEIPPEHKGSLGDTFKYMQDKILGEKKMEEHRDGWFRKMYSNAPKEWVEKRLKTIKAMDTDEKTAQQIREDYAKNREKHEAEYSEFRKAHPIRPPTEAEKEWNAKLEERKREYNVSGRGIDLNKPRTDEEEDERMQSLSLMKLGSISDSPYHNVAGVYLPSAYGADIQAEEAFQTELHGIVDDMKVKLVNEKKILEGTLNPEYGKGDWGMPHIEATLAPNEFSKNIEKPTWHYDGPQDLEYGKGDWRTYDIAHMRTEENELSQPKLTEDQWKNDSQNGSLTTDLTPTSTNDSSSSFSIAKPLNPDFPTVPLRRQSTSSPVSFYMERLDVSGNETDVMREYCDSMEQTISVQMAGTLSEVK